MKLIGCDFLSYDIVSASIYGSDSPNFFERPVTTSLIVLGKLDPLKIPDRKKSLLVSSEHAKRLHFDDFAMTFHFD